MQPSNSVIHPGDHLAGEEVQHPYEGVDPFTTSIPLRIRNNRRQGTINSVDDIGPPRILSRRPSLVSHEARLSRQSLNVARGRPSVESARSQGRQNRRLSPISLESGRGRNATPLYPAHPSIPVKKDANDVTAQPRSTYVAESSGVQQAPTVYHTRDPYHQQPIPSQANGNGVIKQNPSAQSLAPSHTHRKRSPSPFSHRHRFRLFPSFLAQDSDLYLPDDGDEKSIRPGPFQYLRLSLQDITPMEAVMITITYPLQQIYLHSLLRLPNMYWSRVDQIFQDAQLTMEQINEMALRDSVAVHYSKGPFSKMPKAYLRLKKNWEDFIDNLLREWKTLNIISGLLLSGILTIFQIDAAQSDAITRYMAFWSLISALISLLYGCFFIIRFSGMRRVHRAVEWATEAQRRQTPFWNVWTMLAMPAVWLVWSILAYIACIMSFMWRIRPNQPDAKVPPQVGPATEGAFRIFICCVFGIGILYAILIINTLRRYGSKMDRAWKRRIAEFKKSHNEPPMCPTTPTSPPPKVGIVEATPPSGWRRPQWFTPPTTVKPLIPSPPRRPPLTRAPYSPSSPSPLSAHRTPPPSSPTSMTYRPQSFDIERPDTPQTVAGVGEPSTWSEQGGALGLYFPNNPGELDDSPRSSGSGAELRGVQEPVSVNGISTEIKPPDLEPAAGGMVPPNTEDQRADSVGDGVNSNLDIGANTAVLGTPPPSSTSPPP